MISFNDDIWCWTQKLLTLVSLIRYAKVKWRLLKSSKSHRSTTVTFLAYFTLLRLQSFVNSGPLYDETPRLSNLCHFRQIPYNQSSKILLDSINPIPHIWIFKPSIVYDVVDCFITVCSLWIHSIRMCCQSESSLKLCLKWRLLSQFSIFSLEHTILIFLSRLFRGQILNTQRQSETNYRLLVRPDFREFNFSFNESREEIRGIKSCCFVK